VVSGLLVGNLTPGSSLWVDFIWLVADRSMFSHWLDPTCLWSALYFLHNAWWSKPLTWK